MADGPGPGAGAVNGYAHLRASDADRDRSIDMLKAGFAEGRLSGEELDLRQRLALSAPTCGELEALTADLPAGPPGTVGGPPAPSPFPVARRTNRLAIASVIAALIPLYGTVPAILMGHTARRQIRVSREGGGRLAAVGLGLGYLTAALFAVVFLMMSIR